MFKKNKSFEQITSAFTKPLAELSAYIDSKRAEADAKHAKYIMLRSKAEQALADGTDLHTEADKAAAYRYKLEQAIGL